MGSDELDVLLVEDNPGDARLIEEMLRDAEELLQRVDAGASNTGVPQVHHEKRLSAGLEHLADTDVNVVLLDLNLPDSTGLDTLVEVVESTETAPVVVLTGLDDQNVGIQAVQQGAQDYLVKDEVTSDLLVRSIHHAIERHRQERERARRREQLEALNHLNRIGQDVTHAVITTSTREELERAVCERLVESDAYRFAWIGEVDRGTNRVTPRVAAGIEEGYLDEITITVGDDMMQGPAANAVRTHEVQVMQDVQTDPEFEPWREQAKERGYRSSAAIPIVHEDLLYGVLNVYSSSTNAFSEPETEILGRLGDVIGHAITAIERKDALVSDTALELEFRVEGIAEALVGLSAEQSCTIRVGRLIHGNEALLAYGSAENVSREQFADVLERTEEVDDFRILTEEGEEYRFELVVTAARSLVEAVATHGGRVRSATVADGEFRFVVEFPRGRDTRQLVELVEEHCPSAEHFAQRTAQRSDDGVSAARPTIESQLTEKQRVALETAYFSGYFDWPRTSNGEEVADLIGISPSTFTQHLRVAEGKLFGAVFEEESFDGDRL